MTDADFIEVAFKLWRETRLEKADAGDAPEHLYAAIAGAVGDNWRDVAFKLAMWRWSGECLLDPNDDLPARERLVYSAFRDAVRLSGRKDLATSVDHDTQFFADLLTDARAA